MEKQSEKKESFIEQLKENLLGKNIIYQEAEKIGIKKWPRWYWIIGFLGFAPAILAYRKCYQQAAILSTITIVMSLIGSYIGIPNGNAQYLFNILIYFVCEHIYKNKLKKEFENTTEDIANNRETYLKEVFGTNIVAGIGTVIIVLGIVFTILGENI